MTAPVLILFFNRPEPLRQVADRVAAASPHRVYLACDGPREGRADDREFTERCRSIATSRPWSTPPEIRFLERNVGCARAVSEAISWFFSREPEGIVLEDDCLPDPSFFRFATELLARHRDDERVMSINGSCFDLRPRGREGLPSYRFIRTPHVWGWASWARAWRRYSLRLSRADIDSVPVVRYPAEAQISIFKWRKRFAAAARREPTTWDYSWSFAHFRHGGLVASPTRNLVRNLPTEHGTHLTRPNLWQDLPVEPVDDPLVHPAAVERDEDLDRYLERVHCNHRPWLARKLHQLAARHCLVPARFLRRGFP